MVRLQRFAQITVGIHRSTINHSLLCRILRIDLCIGNQDLIRGSVSFPTDIRVSITRIDADLGYLIYRRAIVNRKIINIKEVLTIKITYQRYICAISPIRREIDDILLESLVSPYAHRIYSSEGRYIIRIRHNTYHQAARVVTSRVRIDRAPEMNLALVEMEIRIGSISQSRSGCIYISTRRNRCSQTCRFCTLSSGENQTICLIQRIIATRGSRGRSRVDVRVLISRPASVRPIRITLAAFQSR